MRRLHKKSYDQSDNEKMYNIGFHPIMLYIFPMGMLYSLPINFLIDSIVLLIGFKVFGKEKVWFNWKKSILLSWIFGYIADLIASFLLLGFDWIVGAAFRTSIITKPVSGILPFSATLLCVVAAGILIYFLNDKVALKRTELDDKARKKVALLMAIATAPYLFFMPVVF